jgi:hypothetical protein
MSRRSGCFAPVGCWACQGSIVGRSSLPRPAGWRSWIGVSEPRAAFDGYQIAGSVLTEGQGIPER